MGSLKLIPTTPPVPDVVLGMHVQITDLPPPGLFVLRRKNRYHVYVTDNVTAYGSHRFTTDRVGVRSLLAWLRDSAAVNHGRIAVENHTRTRDGELGIQPGEKIE